MTVTVGLALIARDEERTLPRLLASCAGAFDEVVLCDTGSADGTIAAFEAWAATQPDTRCTVERFAWIDDFGAARRHAHEALTTDWQVWADCDDEIRGATELRTIAAQQPPAVAAVFCGYFYAGGPEHLNWRERLVRAGRGRWDGRIHEVQILDGDAVTAPVDRVAWIHHGDGGSEAHLGGRSRMERDLKLLDASVRDRPGDARAWFYLAQTHRDLGHADHAIEAYLTRAELGGWEEEVYIARMEAGRMLCDGGDWAAGSAKLLEAYDGRPTRLEALYELAWRLRERGQWHSAYALCRTAVDTPVPDDRLFVAPWIHAWGLRFELSINAYWAGDPATGLAACDALLAMDDLPEGRREETVANRVFNVDALRRLQAK